MNDYGIKNKSDWRPATRLVRGGLTRSDARETSEGLFITSGYVYDRAEHAEAAFKQEIQRFVYSRYANPTVAMFQERMALLEGAEYCAATASGMAAVFASHASQLKAGDRVVASRALFGSCFFIVNDLLPRYGIETVLVDGTDIGAWEEALSKPARTVFLETPSNPCLEIIDIRAVCDLAHKVGARSLSITSSRPRYCKNLWIWAPISLFTPRPSTSTGKADAWAARSCPTTRPSSRIN